MKDLTQIEEMLIVRALPIIKVCKVEVNEALLRACG